MINELKIKKERYLNKISKFFRLNLIALNINNFYKLNIYFLIFLFICIIASIIIRTHIINKEMLDITNNNIVLIIFNLLLFFTSLYSFKLIFDIINKLMQGYKVISEFIRLYKENVINIKSIITYYYIQNIFFILLSS